MEKKEDVEEEVRKKGSEAKASAPKGARKVDPVKEIFDRGVQILGPKGRKLIGLARKDHSDVVILEAISACEEEGATDPAGFFFKCLAKRQQRPRNGIYPNEGVF